VLFTSTFKKRRWPENGPPFLHFTMHCRGKITRVWGKIEIKEMEGKSYKKADEKSPAFD
jgi:hypothetical protein